MGLSQKLKFSDIPLDGFFQPLIFAAENKYYIFM